MIVRNHPRIAFDPEICGGRPIVVGTRGRVTDALEMLAGGAGEGEIGRDFRSSASRTSVLAAPMRPTAAN